MITLLLENEEELNATTKLISKMREEKMAKEREETIKNQIYEALKGTFSPIEAKKIIRTINKELRDKYKE